MEKQKNQDEINVRKLVGQAYEGEKLKYANLKKQSIVNKFLKKDNFPQITKQLLTQKFLSQYSNQLITQIKQTCKISQTYFTQQKKITLSSIQRAKVIKQLLNHKSKQDHEVYFLTIEIMDLILQKSSSNFTFQKLLQLSQSCWNISTKFLTVNQKQIDSKDETNFKKYKIDIAQQIEILALINFSFPKFSVHFCFQFILILVQNQFKLNLNKNQIQKAEFILKVIFIDQQIFKQNKLQLSTATFIFAINKFNLLQSHSHSQKDIKHFLIKTFDLCNDTVQKISNNLQNYDFQ